MNSFTVDELMTELRNIAKSAPRGGATKVCVRDVEWNIAVEELHLEYSADLDKVVLLFDQFENV